MVPIESLDDEIRIRCEAAAFRTLVAHLQDRTDVQNIDLMNLAGFCRNCLSKYLVAAAAGEGLELGYEDGREHVYGRPYAAWKAEHQTDATDQQQRAFDDAPGAKHR